MRIFLSTVALLFVSQISAIAQEDTLEDKLTVFNAQAASLSQAVFIEQIGNDNLTNVRQSGPENTAFIAIDGNGNGTSILGGNLLQEDTTNSATVIMNGNGNDFDLTQSGSSGNNLIELFQTGNDNSATIGQSAFQASSNIIRTWQTGNSNNLIAIQEATFAAMQNEINLIQTGNGNSALFTQQGGGNLINADQVGDNISATYTQIGSENSITSVQTGLDLDYSITQFGNASISVIQTNLLTTTN